MSWPKIYDTEIIAGIDRKQDTALYFAVREYASRKYNEVECSH